MKTIYTDSEFKCHTSNDGTMTAVETDAFDGKCDAFIEGHCYEVKPNGWVSIYPWKDNRILQAYQEQYEAMGGAAADAETIEKAAAYDYLLGGDV